MTTINTETAPQELRGISIYSGSAYGLCQIFSSGNLEIPQFSIAQKDVRGEMQRLRAAIHTVDKQLAELAAGCDEDMPAEAVAFIDVHRALVADPSILDETIAIIKERLINAEWALAIRLDRTRREFDAIDDIYLRERIQDISQVILRVQRVLTGRRNPSQLWGKTMLDDKIILVADQLDPADMLQLRSRVDLDIAGIILEEGSLTSHAAILARSLEIPTLVGVQNARALLSDEPMALLDADNGCVLLHPSAEGRKQARARMRALAGSKRQLRRLKPFEAVTLDGRNIHLYANISLPDEVRDVHRVGANGVGLFRTEYLFINRDDLPGEDEQYEAYAKVIRSMRGRPVIIRTADLGGDKMLSAKAMALLTDNAPDEPNPSLGLRGLRFCFAHEEILITQLKAILRAARSGNVKILLPMVTSPEDVEKVRDFIDRARAQLKADGVKHADTIEVGGMIELPAAVVMLRDLIPVLDFFSLGTNDLIQYTLAVDRTNAAVSQYYNERHPSVLRLIAESIRKVHHAGKSISVCGEMAARKELVPFFIGLGCTRLSMTLSEIPAIKERILKVDQARAEEFAQSVLRRRSIRSINQCFEKFEHNFQTPHHTNKKDVKSI